MDTLISQRKIDFWIKNEVNVMLIGKHGIGKTHIAKDAAKKAGLGFQYFSCATLDPWVDFIGVPKVRAKTVLRKGKKVKVQYLELVRPKAFAFDEVEFLFLDELNRADPKVMNAVLELIQFRSINGRKFKNLKCIWAAINPPASMTGDVAYHVQELDPALMSRFQVRVNLPFEPALDYFTNKFGKPVAKNACNWWMKLTDAAKDDFPPRSMDYALEYIGKGGDVEDVLPLSISKLDFIQLLDDDFNVADVIVESYDLVQSSLDLLSENLLTNIRYATSPATAAPYIKKVRESSMEEVMALALNLLSGSVMRDVNNGLMCLIGSAARPVRNRLLSELYTSYIASTDDEDGDEPVAKYDLDEQQARAMGLFLTKKLADYGPKFKFRNKSKSYDLVKFDHDSLTPCDTAPQRTSDDILSRQQAAEEKRQGPKTAGVKGRSLAASF